MRNCVLLLAIAVCPELSLGWVRAGPSTHIDPQQIAHLITQLGSANFKERDAATQALEEIGGPALEAVQHAALSSDPEVGRRAQSLARIIRKRIETAHFLVPLSVRLVYRETPVLQAVKDFAEKTKFPMDIVGSRARLANRKITLDTGETSFWEAFDQFCQKAGLIEGTAPAGTEVQEAQRLLLDAAQGRARGVVQIVEAPSLLGVGRAWDGRLSLADGHPPLLPTDHIGAVRVRALPAKVAAGPAHGEPILFLMEITPQPKLAWHNILDLRIDRAVDENGHDLASSLETQTNWNQVAVAGTGIVVWDSQTGQPFAAPRDIPVHVKAEAKPSGILKEVKGVFAAQVQTPPQAIMTVDNILKSTGRTVIGDDGESLKVLAADRQPDGNVHVQVELTDPSTANVVWTVRRGVLRPNGVRLANGAGRRGALAMDSTAPTTLVLQDADGHSFPQANPIEEPANNANLLTRQITCTYQSRPGLGEPRKLVYSGRRMVIIEVPFTLKDVPLP